MKSKKVEFMPPSEVTDQVGAADAGTRLELMTTYNVKDNGQWCIVSIEGVPMPGYDAQGNPEGGKEDHMDMGAGERMAGKMKEAMSGMGAGGGY
jgi:hypothetical protein